MRLLPVFYDERPSHWRIAGIDFELDPDLKVVPSHLKPQTPECDILSRLVHVAYPEASRCALDMIFRYGFNCDFYDALQAYSERPLPDPPAEYRDVCYSHDFATTSAANLSAIVLAGSQDPSDKTRLIDILEVASSDMRDGPLYAAASFRTEHMVDLLVRLAMREEEAVLGGSGELFTFGYIYKRWVREGVVTREQFYRLCKSHERNDGKAIRAEEFMNCVICRNWRDLLVTGTR